MNPVQASGTGDTPVEPEGASFSLNEDLQAGSCQWETEAPRSLPSSVAVRGLVNSPFDLPVDEHKSPSWMAEKMKLSL